MGYGFGLYRDRPTGTCGVRFGFGQVQVGRWDVTVCLFRTAYDLYPDGYNRHWFTVGK